MKRKKIYVVDMEIVNPHGYKSLTTRRYFLCGCVALRSSKVNSNPVLVEMKIEYDQRNVLLVDVTRAELSFVFTKILRRFKCNINSYYTLTILFEHL